MKKALAFILAVLMFMLASPLTSAAPGGYALFIGGDGPYFIFNSVSLPAAGGKISFDLSMEANEYGSPNLSINGQITITGTAISIKGVSTPINWGTLAKEHFRFVEIAFSGGSVTVSLDGAVAATGSGASTESYIYFLESPGFMYMDNLKVENAGNTVLSIDFDDLGVFNSCKGSDSSAVRAALPEGSYYDYSTTGVPDDVEYIFNSAANAAKLSIQAGVEKYRGDVNGDDKINNRDLTMVKRIVVGDTPDGAVEELADVNGDGSFTTKDAAALKKLISGVNQPVKVVISVGGGSGSVAFDSAMQSARLTCDAATLDGIEATLAMTAISASDYKYAVVTYLTPNAPEAGNANSAVANKSAFGAWGNLKQYDLTTDGKFHSQVVDLSDVSTWNGDAATLRFFTAANAGDKLYVDSIIFCANLSRANAAKAAREAAKASLTITDVVEPDPSGAIGSYDADGNYQIIFDKKAKVDAKVSPVNNTRISFADSAIKATATSGADPSFYVDLTDEHISASTFEYIVYVYKNPLTNGSAKGSNMYYVVDGIDVPTGGYQTDISGGVKSDTYNGYVLDLTAKSNWTGAIKGIRIDYFTDCNSG
ncbi:MAG: dockerin type I repeat-containing protein, partial [Clostridia bacterium]|nr:dockerin type I repeat-containing protein [Clostridia bacterium]